MKKVGFPSWSKENQEKCRKRMKENNPSFKPEIVEKIRKSMKGKNYKDGSSRWYKQGYWTKEYLQWRKSVFERDEYTCQVCRKVGCYLTAHHIKSFAHYPELRFIISNGVTLCESCHSLTDNYRGRGHKKYAG